MLDGRQDVLTTTMSPTRRREGWERWSIAVYLSQQRAFLPAPLISTGEAEVEVEVLQPREPTACLAGLEEIERQKREGRWGIEERKRERKGGRGERQCV